MSIISNLYFSVLVLALIVLVDVVVKFKKPRVLKFFFLLLPFSIGIIALINSTGAIEYVFYLAFFKTAMAAGILNIFSILYFPKFKRKVLAFTLCMSLFTIFLMLVNKGVIASGPFVDRFKTISVDENLNVKITPLVRLIRFMFLFVVASNIGYFWYVIYKKINLNNIYFEKIRIWTTFVFILSCFVIFANITLALTAAPPFYVNVLTLFILFYILLLVLKRPSFLNHSGVRIALGQKFNQDADIIIDQDAFNLEFYNHRYFTNQDASIEKLSLILKVNSGELSAFVMNEYEMSFNELVNKNRVAYFLEVVQNPQFQNFTIDALAKEVGFSSRQHLHKPFKKFHGGNPSDLLDGVDLNA